MAQGVDVADGVFVLARVVVCVDQVAIHEVDAGGGLPNQCQYLCSSHLRVRLPAHILDRPNRYCPELAMDAVWVENLETASASETVSVEYSVTALAVEMAKSATAAYSAWWSVCLNWSVRLPLLRQSYLADKFHFQGLGSAWPNGAHSNLFYHAF